MTLGLSSVPVMSVLADSPCSSLFWVAYGVYLFLLGLAAVFGPPLGLALAAIVGVGYLLLASAAALAAASVGTLHASLIALAVGCGAPAAAWVVASSLLVRWSPAS